MNMVDIEGIVLSSITLLIAAYFILSGGIPLFKRIKIRGNGVRTTAHILSVKLISEATTRSPCEYSANIQFRDESGKVIRAVYSSRFDYLSLFQNKYRHDVELVFSKNDPHKFYLPKDKGAIGWDIIKFFVGLFVSCFILFVWIDF